MINILLVGNDVCVKWQSKWVSYSSGFNFIVFSCNHCRKSTRMTANDIREKFPMNREVRVKCIDCHQEKHNTVYVGEIP